MPPAVALLNYIGSGIHWLIFCQTEIFAGFFLNNINFAVFSCTSAQCVFNMHVCDTTNNLIEEENNKKRIIRRGRIVRRIRRDKKRRMRRE